MVSGGKVALVQKLFVVSGVKGVWFEVSGVKVAWCKMGVV